jgi:hypothetical protein
VRAPKRPSLFKQRDLARAIRSARAAGATKAHIEIAKDGTIRMDLRLGGICTATSSLRARRFTSSKWPTRRASPRQKPEQTFQNDGQNGLESLTVKMEKA